MDGMVIEGFSGERAYLLAEFDCGEPRLNAFLIEHLARQHTAKILRGYILRDGMRVMGYYTLSGSCFEKDTLPSRTQQRKVPYHNVPSVTLGRLAVDRSLQGQQWGATLVAHAMQVVYQASQAVGIHGLFVDALNERASAFYQHLGFVPLTGKNAHALFYSTASIERLFRE